jgi:hypothetical protein
VPIRRRGLHDLQQHGSAQHDAANEKQVPWVGEAKEGAEDSEREDVLKMSVGLHRRLHQEW